MFSLKLVPDDTHIDFVAMRKIAYIVSGLLIAASIALFFTRGLNFGIDFRGGTLIEIQTQTAQADLASLRSTLGDLGL
ncbi:MAG: protein translocase subunit SecF, partial [Alphaproteobacteria bacterium]|nr:protein translocase subunit SecF [Alphaproteobacteria bacterium]